MLLSSICIFFEKVYNLLKLERYFDYKNNFTIDAIFTHEHNFYS